MTTGSTIQVREVAGVRVLALHGEIDAFSAPPVGAELPRIIEGARAVVLDLTDVTFFDSSGLRLVDVVARTCRDLGVPWRAVSPAASGPRRVLEIVGMAGSHVVVDVVTAQRQLAG